MRQSGSKKGGIRDTNDFSGGEVAFASIVTETDVASVAFPLRSSPHKQSLREIPHLKLNSSISGGEDTAEEMLDKL